MFGLKKKNKVSDNLKLIRCIKHLNLGISYMKKSEQLKTIIQMENHLKVNQISDKKGTSLIQGTSLTMNESSESALKMAGLTLSLVYKGFADAGKHEVFYEALFYITTILKKTMLHYITAKESEQLVGNHKVATRNDFLFCLCSAIVYKLGVYVFPKEGVLLDVKVDNRRYLQSDGISHMDSVANGTAAAKLQLTSSMQEELAEEALYERMSTNKKVPKGSERMNKKVKPDQFYSYIGGFITGNTEELDVEYFVEYLTDHLNNNSKPKDIDLENAFNFEKFRDNKTLVHLLPLIECVSKVCSRYGGLLILKPSANPIPKRLNFLNSRAAQQILGNTDIATALKDIAVYFQNN